MDKFSFVCEAFRVADYCEDEVFTLFFKHTLFELLFVDCFDKITALLRLAKELCLLDDWVCDELIKQASFLTET